MHAILQLSYYLLQQLKIALPIVNTLYGKKTNSNHMASKTFHLGHYPRPFDLSHVISMAVATIFSHCFNSASSGSRSTMIESGTIVALASSSSSYMISTAVP